ncbi:MAG: DUF3369 domain-containing protein [Spirochaetales bacterium]|nr:DUF3369 domain-containing protein [Spirochaetales bacterium]
MNNSHTQGIDNEDEILYAEEEIDQNIQENTSEWKIIIVDDEYEIHNVTKMVLSDVTYKGQRLKFLHAYSGKETIKLVKENPDTALILLDVVMEEDNSGLEVIKYIRDVLKNPLVRIVIRTGQPGEAPEKKVIVDYDINDYKEKTELTSQKLFSTVIASLRSYENLMTIDRNRKGLEKIIEASARLFEMQQIARFLQEILVQLKALFNLDTGIEDNSISGFIASKIDNDYVIMAAIGRFENNLKKKLSMMDPDSIVEKIYDLRKQNKAIRFDKSNYLGLLKSKIGNDHIIYIETPGAFTESDRYLIKVLYSNISSVFENIQLTNEIEDTQKEILYTLGEVVENRHHETGYHVKKVAEYSYLLAIKYGLDEEEAHLIKQASPMHDVGKVGILDSILNKPGKLTPEEFEVIKTHTSIGYNIFKSSQRNLLKAAAIIAFQHHEKYDGTGYPRGLKGENIHIYGRITCIADVFDALGSDRVYKKAWSLDQILEYIQSESGKSFDPKLVQILFDYLDEFLIIRDSVTPEGVNNKKFP